MKCIACGDKTVDYKVIEDFVFSIEEKYDVVVMGIGYDRYNALSSAQKWDTISPSLYFILNTSLRCVVKQ